jgi:transcriptional regulator GlxA family with amidase domain
VIDAARTRADGVDQRIAELVARASSHLDRHPGVDDLAVGLGLPERRASERVGSYFRRHHASFDGWRSYVATLRVELAWNLLGGRRLRAAEIATRLGYRSAPALYHALHRRGLTPP